MWTKLLNRKNGNHSALLLVLSVWKQSWKTEDAYLVFSILVLKIWVTALQWGLDSLWRHKLLHDPWIFNKLSLSFLDPIWVPHSYSRGAENGFLKIKGWPNRIGMLLSSPHRPFPQGKIALPGNYFPVFATPHGVFCAHGAACLSTGSTRRWFKGLALSSLIVTTFHVSFMFYLGCHFS